MINWYAVQAKSYNEARVHHHLMQRVIPAFLPLIETIRRWRSRRIVRLEPLFPGYLFVQLQHMDVNPSQWDLVRWAPGVKSILGVDGTPMPVPDDVVDAIKTRVQHLGFVRPGTGFRQNVRVFIRGGPLARLGAVFERQLSGSGRVQILMQLLGQPTRVQVDAIDLELV